MKTTHVLYVSCPFCTYHTTVFNHDAQPWLPKLLLLVRRKKSNQRNKKKTTGLTGEGLVNRRIGPCEACGDNCKHPDLECGRHKCSFCDFGCAPKAPDAAVATCSCTMVKPFYVFAVQSLCFFLSDVWCCLRWLHFNVLTAVLVHWMRIGTQRHRLPAMVTNQ